MNTLEGLLRAIVANPQTEGRYLVLADYLEEHDDPRRAELLRLHRRLLATCCEPEKHPERAAWHAMIVELIGQRVRPCVPRRSVVLGEGVEMNFVFIPPGSFLMGSPESEEGRHVDEALHRVTLRRGFWMGVYPVTQTQWKAVMGTIPRGCKQKDHPVITVSWGDCMAFCERLGKSFRLPTEAEWEFACRAGTTTAYYTGDGPDALSRAGWCSYNAYWGDPGYTEPVGQFDPNAWGLFDLHGSVYEWCAAWYGPYPEKAVQDYRGPPSGKARVLRGRSRHNDPGACRSAYRAAAGKGYCGGRTGCRVVLCPDESRQDWPPVLHAGPPGARYLRKLGAEGRTGRAGGVGRPPEGDAVVAALFYARCAAERCKKALEQKATTQEAY